MCCIPCDVYKFLMSSPWYFIGEYTKSLAIDLHTPIIGNPPCSIGDIILLHCSCVNVNANSGYSNFFITVEFSADHASYRERCPALILSYHIAAVFLI